MLFELAGSIVRRFFLQIQSIDESPRVNVDEFDHVQLHSSISMLNPMKVLTDDRVNSSKNIDRMDSRVRGKGEERRYLTVRLNHRVEMFDRLIKLVFQKMKLMKFIGFVTNSFFNRFDFIHRMFD